MKIKDLKEENRPREKLMLLGAETLSNEELLAILISSGTKEASAIDIATKVINSLTSIKDLATLSYNELSGISGIKKTKATTIIASFELAKRIMSFMPEETRFDNPKEVYNLMYPILSTEKVECFYALYLNIKCQLIEKRLITKGSVESVIFDVKEVLRYALKNSCYSIIIVHNHPSGDSKPSNKDLEVTKEFVKASRLLNILVLDHIIIGAKGYYSFASMNKLD